MLKKPKCLSGCPIWLLLLATLYLNCQSGADKSIQAQIPVHQDTLPAPKPAADKKYLLGQFDPARHPDFKVIEAPYTNRPGMSLRKEALEAFELMYQAAQKAGVTLTIISSTRTFSQQKTIWENKWKRYQSSHPDPKDRALKILEYSSMPGSSRHHWGTDIDLNDLNNASFEKGGKYEKVYVWLVAHAHEYGFCQPYTAGRPAGYQEEKWHWTYSPISKGLLEAYRNSLSEADIQGFMGAETAPAIGIVQNYVLGINELCR